jgi:hypothetical protein
MRAVDRCHEFNWEVSRVQLPEKVAVAELVRVQILKSHDFSYPLPWAVLSFPAYLWREVSKRLSAVLFFFFVLVGSITAQIF